jgi:hypothetical protein
MPAIIQEKDGILTVRFLFEGNVWLEQIPQENFFSRLRELFHIEPKELSAYLYELQKMEDAKPEPQAEFYFNGQELVPLGVESKSKPKKEQKQMSL